MELIRLYCSVKQDTRYSNRDLAAEGSVFVFVLTAVSVPSAMLGFLFIKPAEQQN